MTLIRRSSYLIAAMLIIHVYRIVQFSQYTVPLIRLISNLILVFLFSRWLLDFQRLWKPNTDYQVLRTVFSHIRFIIFWSKYLTIAYLLALWALSSDALLLLILRLVLEVGLVSWCVIVWRQADKAKPSDASIYKRSVSAKKTMMKGVSYAIVIVGLIIEFAGYTSLSVHWYASCAKSIVVVFWIAIWFMVIRELHQDYRNNIHLDQGEDLKSGFALYWLFRQVAWFFWIILGCIGLVLAWSTNLEVLTIIHGYMSQPFFIGKIGLSILGLIYAVIILFLTYILTGIGRYLFQEKVFARDTMEPGLKVSITSISIYLIWGLGLIIALSILGVSATSLAVVFGALSIGIGFGLQNIFNNFISGIILLFERPIQVGDNVEISGVWATVKKINVRSTVVQTYDNASLIIPNSEFISNQVTNWSFKDKRLRRSIAVGVAYGSDVQLVRHTLLEISANAPNVLKHPKPDVLFTDFGDSALIFKVRVWTQLDDMFTVETHIRFEIDRIFKERNIVIAFPQRDIHIRSISKNTDIDIEQQPTEGS